MAIGNNLQKQQLAEKDSFPLPSISELGLDLIRLSKFQLFLTIFLPLLSFSMYFVFAFIENWILAVASVILFSFFTYGSTSHDLVHMNLGLKKNTNDFLLFLMELLSLRSGHAYRLAHLHHHAMFPHESDIEGAASKMTFIRTVWEGIIFQYKIWTWAFKNVKKPGDKKWIQIEGVLCSIIIISSILLIPVSPVFVIYVILIIMGSWLIPFITSYIPHDPNGSSPLFQTKVFRGRFFSLIALEHLYHLEHHLYPSVPHKNWVKLAKRLDPYFEAAGIKPKKFLF